MTLSFRGVLADAWAMWRRDRDLLVRIGAPFLFVPSLALQLLAPLPSPDPAAELQARMQAQVLYIQDHLPIYIIALAVVQFGLASLTAFYCSAAGDVRQALGRGLALWVRFILLGLVSALLVFGGFWFLVIGALIVLGRTLVAMPVLVADQPIGAVAALARAVRLSAGQTLPTMMLSALLLAGRLVALEPFVEIDDWLRRLSAPNPVALAIVDAAAAGVNMLAEIAGVVVAVAAYRALVAGASRTGT